MAMMSSAYSVVTPHLNITKLSTLLSRDPLNLRRSLGSSELVGEGGVLGATKTLLQCHWQNRDGKDSQFSNIRGFPVLTLIYFTLLHTLS